MGKPLQAADYSRFTAFPDLGLSPVALHLGPFDLRWYSLAYLAGIIVGYWYLLKLIDKPGSPMGRRHADDLAFYAALGIFLGGRIGYVLFYNLPYYAEHPLEVFELWNGGMSFHGGFLGCVAAVMLFGWKRNVSILSLGDLTCAAAPIGLFLGRLANFVNGELWGRPTDVPWAMVFPHTDGVPRHPSQIYEATLEGLVLFTLLYILIRRGALKRPGLILGAFALLYAFARSFCEFFREPDAQLGFLWGNMTMGMLLSIPLAVAGIILIAYVLRQKPEQA
jgi:phosphatidylglycerol:prolipoprotein diacylglycerol transferase